MGNRDIWDELELNAKGEFMDEEMFEYLSAYADGECTAKERRLVEAYLAENSEARAILADLRAQAAFVAEDLQEPPAWLQSAILDRTTARRTFRWPFAAGLAAATAAAGIAAVVWMPRGGDDPVRDFIARSAPQARPLDPPVYVEDLPGLPTEVPAMSEPAEVEQRTVPPTSSARRVQAPRQTPDPVSLRGAGNRTEATARTEPKPVPAATEQPDTNYVVVEYANARSEPKQPVVSAAAPTGDEPSTVTQSKPDVLPDARQRLRDRVKKMNEEQKLEIDTEEKA